MKSSVGDSDPLPQFQNNTPNSGYSYINDDADFVADNLSFDCPNRITKAAFAVRYGRIVRYSNILGHCWVGLAPGEMQFWICGDGNQFYEYGVPPSATYPSIVDALVFAADKRIDVAFNKVEEIASASTINPKIGTGVAYITGTTSILNIGTSGFEGQKLILIFSAAIAVADGGPGNLRLASTFSADADDTLTLVCRNNLWYEIGRSAN